MITGRSGAIRLSSACKPCSRPRPSGDRNRHVRAHPARQRAWPELALSGSWSAQILGQRADHIVVIVDHQYGRLLAMRAVAGSRAHGCHREFDDEPQHTDGPELKVISPSCSRTYDWLTARPMPAPLPGSPWSMKNGAKTRCLVLGSDARAGILEREHRARALPVVLGVRGHAQRSTRSAAWPHFDTS